MFDKKSILQITLAKFTLNLDIRIMLLGLMIFSIVFLNSCSSAKSSLKKIGLGSVVGYSHTLKNISIEAVYNSNINSPVAVDFLFIYDENVTAVLSELNGPQWFKEKQGLLKRYYKEMDVISLEVVPLSYVNTVDFPKKHKNAKNILMFSNYREAHGQYIAELNYFKQLKIRLLKDSYQLIEEAR